MRTLELHDHAKQIQRSSGRSSVGAAAYRSATKLVDERTGLIHDFTRKQGVEFSRIYTPDNAPDWAQDRGKLWNACEVKENRKNSCTGNDTVFAFPWEFNALQRRETGHIISRDYMQRYNCAVDISYHEPDREGDKRNYHAHLMFTTRGFDDTTKDGWKKGKIAELRHDRKDKDGKDYLDAAGKKTTRGGLEITDLRKFAADTMNRIAGRDGLAVKVEHLSYEARGIEREASQKMGAYATQMERDGQPSERGDINREITASNDNRDKLKAQKNVVILEHARALRALKKKLAQVEQQEKKTAPTVIIEAQRSVNDPAIAAKEARYQQDQETLKTMETALASRSNIDRIMGAITGKARSQKAQIAQLQGDIKTYEADRHKQQKNQLEAGQSANDNSLVLASKIRDKNKKQQPERKPLHAKTTGELADDHVKLAQNPMSDLQRWNSEAFRKRGGRRGSDSTLPDRLHPRYSEHSVLQPLRAEDERRSAERGQRLKVAFTAAKRRVLESFKQYKADILAFQHKRAERAEKREQGRAGFDPAKTPQPVQPAPRLTPGLEAKANPQAPPEKTGQTHSLEELQQRYAAAKGRADPQPPEAGGKDSLRARYNALTEKAGNDNTPPVAQEKLQEQYSRATEQQDKELDKTPPRQPDSPSRDFER